MAGDALERHGVYAGLPLRVANILRRHELRTRAQVVAWYRADPRSAGATRGMGPRGWAALLAWLGADAEDRGDGSG